MLKLLAFLAIIVSSTSLAQAAIPDPVARIGEAEAIDALRERASELAKQDAFSGQLLVARHGKVLLEQAWGLADRDKEPGSAFEYSNYGYLPAGMKNTGSLPEEVDLPHRAKGYTRRDGAWTSNTDTLPYRGMGAGGGYSTARDLFAFAQALQAGKLISKAMLEQATAANGSGDGVGLCFLHDGAGATRMFGHNVAATGPMIFFTRRMPLTQ